jgi:hypothetical protein
MTKLAENWGKIYFDLYKKKEGIKDRDFIHLREEFKFLLGFF